MPFCMSCNLTLPRSHLPHPPWRQQMLVDFARVLSDQQDCICMQLCVQLCSEGFTRVDRRELQGSASGEGGEVGTKRQGRDTSKADAAESHFAKPFRSFLHRPNRFAKALTAIARSDRDTLIAIYPVGSPLQRARVAQSLRPQRIYEILADEQRTAAHGRIQTVGYRLAHSEMRACSRIR